MAAFLDNCKFTPTAGGTTDWTFSAAVTGYQSPSAAGVVNGSKYKYFAISADLTQWEIGEGAYNTSTGVLPRTTILYSTNSNAKVTFTTAPTVAIIAILEDMVGAQDSFATGMAGGTLVASVASNILTVAVKTFAGNDPSASDPVFFYFRDATSATGDYTARVVTSALNITTNAAGASLGVPASQPFRLWVHAFDNAGTVVLALWQSVTFASAGNPTGLACWCEGVPASTTGISASATAAATFYTPNGTSLTTKSFTPLGYMDFASLTTAGDYTAVPASIQLYRAGVKRPGDTGNRAYGSTTTAVSNSTNTFTNTNLTSSITPSSAAALVHIDWSGTAITSDGANANALVQMFRSSIAVGTIHGVGGGATTSFKGTVGGKCWDAPGATSSTTYTAKLKNDDNATSVSFPFNTTGAEMTLTEIIV